MKTYENGKTSVTVTELRDYAIWGEWEGSQSEAEGIINELPGASGVAKLFDCRGHAAADNASEGAFCVDCKTAEWDSAFGEFAILNTEPLDKLDGKAPVYMHYQGQCQPQNAYLELHQDGKIYAEYNPEIGNAVPMDVWHGRTLQFRISCCLTEQGIRDCVDHYRQEFEAIIAGFDERWDGSNWVGTLTNDASIVVDRLQRQFADSQHDWESVEIHPAADWLNSWEGADKITQLTTDKQLEDMVSEIEDDIDELTMVQGVESYLEELRDDADEPTGQEFAAARKAAGFSQQALADALNVARATVSRWEGGEPPKTAALALRSLIAAGVKGRDASPNERQKMTIEKFELKESATSCGNIWTGEFAGVCFEVSPEFDHVYMTSEESEETETWEKEDGEWINVDEQHLTRDWPESYHAFVEDLLNNPEKFRVSAFFPTLRKEG